jgi:hypothetical protein
MWSFPIQLNNIWSEKWGGFWRISIILCRMNLFTNQTWIIWLNKITSHSCGGNNYVANFMFLVKKISRPGLLCNLTRQTIINTHSKNSKEATPPVWWGRKLCLAEYMYTCSEVVIQEHFFGVCCIVNTNCEDKLLLLVNSMLVKIVKIPSALILSQSKF